MLINISGLFVDVFFNSTTYTVTEGLDEFAVLTVSRSGDLGRKTTVTLTTFDGSANGM